MKIGWVAPGGFDRSGRERVIPVFLGLLERLAKTDEVHVFALRQGTRPDVFTIRGASIHELGGASTGITGLPLLRRALRSITVEHRRQAFEVLHGFWASQSGFAAVLAGKLLRVPAVVTVAGGELARLPEIGYGGFLNARERWQVKVTLRLATCVTAATEFALRPIRDVRADALRLPLGIDMKHYPSTDNRQPTREWRLIQVAHLNRVKDQPTLLRAFHRIRQHGTEARLEILGEDTLQGKIQSMASDLGLADAISFPGVLPVDQVIERLRQSDLMLHTSRHECGQVVFLEAAASGVATAGTAVGYVADLAPECASAVPVADPEALAAQAVRLLRSREERVGIANRAREYTEMHDADWTTCRLREIYANPGGPHTRMDTGATIAAAPVNTTRVK